MRKLQKDHLKLGRSKRTLLNSARPERSRGKSSLREPNLKLVSSGPATRSRATAIIASVVVLESEKVRLTRGRIHAIRWPVCETHRSLCPHHITIQLFHQASRSVAVPTFRTITSLTSTWFWRASPRSVLYCNRVWGWSWLCGLREIPAVQAYGVGCRQMLSCCW